MARLLISLICVAGNIDTGRKPGLNSQMKNVPPKEGREQRLLILLTQVDVRCLKRLLLRLGFGLGIVFR